MSFETLCRQALETILRIFSNSIYSRNFLLRNCAFRFHLHANRQVLISPSFYDFVSSNVRLTVEITPSASDKLPFQFFPNCDYDSRNVARQSGTLAGKLPAKLPKIPHDRQLIPRTQRTRNGTLVQLIAPPISRNCDFNSAVRNDTAFSLSFFLLSVTTIRRNCVHREN